MDFEQIGARIKLCRKRKHWTQEKFAEIIDVSPHYIYEIERGSKTMSIYTLESVASNLEVSIDYLIHGVSSCELGKPNKPDNLELIIETIPPKKRDAVAEIIQSILPYLK